MALTAWEDDTCPGCGQPRTFSHDDDSKGRWQHETTTCHACAALEAKAPKDDEQHVPGRKAYLRPDVWLAHAIEHPLPQQT